MQTSPSVAVAPIATTTDAKSLTTKDKVTEYFSDIPIMVNIAQCESDFRQTNPDGTIFRGIENSSDVGVMQINEKYHLEKAKELGYDIYTVEGNMEFARYLYGQEGARPWLSSSHCWADYKDIATK